MNNPLWIILHCTDVSYKISDNQLDSVNQYHQKEGFTLSRLGYYVGYHRFITGGKNYKTRMDTEVGCHTNQKVNGVSLNQQSLAVCIGFDGDIEYPHPDDYALLQKQVWDWQDMYAMPNDRVVFHRHFNTSKSCPGSLLGVEWMTNLLRRTPEAKPLEQEEKQKEILLQKISILQRLINLYLQLRK